MKNHRYSFLFFLFSLKLISQEISFSKINDSLIKNSNAIVSQTKEILIESNSSYTVKTKRKVWVLNAKGISSIEAYEFYGSNESVKQIKATIYDSSGKEIKSFKRKDFKDESVSGGSFITDNRILSLEIHSENYPFCVVYESETKSKNTAFIPTWYSFEDYNCSILNSSISVQWADDVLFKYKLYNENSFNIEKEISEYKVKFSVSNVVSFKDEP